MQKVYFSAEKATRSGFEDAGTRENVSLQLETPLVGGAQPSQPLLFSQHQNPLEIITRGFLLNSHTV